jgi:hypothetical protein
LKEAWLGAEAAAEAPEKDLAAAIASAEDSAWEAAV